jgi:hypothetical protein
MSAIGSVITALPTRFLRAGDYSLVAQPAEADPAELELAIDGTRPATQGTAMFEPTAELRFALGFFNLGFTGHEEPFVSRSARGFLKPR